MNEADLVDNKQEAIPVKPENKDSGKETSVETLEDLANLGEAKIADAAEKVGEMNSENGKRFEKAGDSIGLTTEKREEIRNSGDFGAKMMAELDAGEAFIAELKAGVMQETGGVDMRQKHEEQSKVHEEKSRIQEENSKKLFEAGVTALEQGKNRAIENMKNGDYARNDKEQAEIQANFNKTAEEIRGNKAKDEQDSESGVAEAVIEKAEPTIDAKTENTEGTKLKTAIELAIEKTVAEKNQEEMNSRFSKAESAAETVYPTAEARQAHINSQESDLEKTTREADEVKTSPDLTTPERRQAHINSQKSDYEKTVEEINNQPKTLEEKNQEVINATESDLEKAARVANESQAAEKVQEKSVEKGPNLSERIKQIQSEEDLFNFIESDTAVSDSRREDIKNTTTWALGMLERTGAQAGSATENILNFLPKNEAFRAKVLEIAQKKVAEKATDVPEEDNRSPEAKKIDAIMNGEKSGEAKETGKEKSLLEIGRERRAAMVEKGKKVWESISASITKSSEGLKEKINNAVDYALASPEAVKRGAKEAQEAMIDACVRTSEGLDALADRGHKAVENLISRTSAAKNKFVDYVNQKRIERLNAKEAKNKKKLDEIMRKKVNPLQSRIDEIRKKKAKIASKRRG